MIGRLLCGQGGMGDLLISPSPHLLCFRSLRSFRNFRENVLDSISFLAYYSVAYAGGLRRRDSGFDDERK